MKKIIVLLAVLFTFSAESFATHLVGGEISWVCLASGSYEFRMIVFRDCTGIPWTFRDETITIVGSPGPGTGGISVSPDIVRWQNANFGDTSPECYDQSQEKSCQAQDPGTIQAFYYKSAPVTLTGVPPSNGWTFYWQAPCCRTLNTNVANLVTNAGSQQMLLRAKMFPTANNDNANPCVDSSPEFRALPTTLITRGYDFTFNHTAIDPDLDSIVYAWDRTYDSPTTNPFALPYKAGYAFNNPTDDATFDARNIPATLNPITGAVKLRMFSGNGAQKYFTVTRVDSWRNGRIIAQVFREFPFVFFDPTPLGTGLPNKKPEVYLDGVLADQITAEIVAGQRVNVSVNVVDQDATGTGLGIQTISLAPNGFAFARDFKTPSFCNTPSFSSCAILQNQSTTVINGEEKIQGLGALGAEFVWQTLCEHVATAGTGIPGTNEGIYNFVMRVQDDHCPIPALNYPTITVKVRDPFPLTEPIMKGASVGLDGIVTYSWAPPIDSTTTYDKYLYQSSVPANGNPVTWFGTTTGTYIKRYQKEYKEPNLQILDNNGGIIGPKPPRDWYVRLITESGCDKDVQSVPSEPVRVMELEGTPVGALPDPLRSEVRLNWNAPKPPNAATKPYFAYESETTYYIYENDSVATGGVADPANWYLRGSTDQLTFNVKSNTCSGPIAFRVEARDTVITYKQATAPRQDSTILLAFSTFSLVDTVFMVTRGFIPPPKLDTIAKLANGDVFLKINSERGSTGRYEILDENGALIKQIDGDVDSVLLTGTEATALSYRLKAIDQCDANNVEFSGNYEIYQPTATLTGPVCDRQITAAWTVPAGFPKPINGFRLQYSTISPDGPFENGPRLGANARQDIISELLPLTDYYVRVIAYDNDEAVNISNVRTLTTVDFRNEIIVPPPVLRTTYVNDDGTITVGFADSIGANLTPQGTKNLRRELSGPNAEQNYIQVEYRLNGGAWQRDEQAASLFARRDVSVDVAEAGVNAQLQVGVNDIRIYDIRVRTLSGCLGNEPSDWSNEISTININALARQNDREKRGDIKWNGTGVDYGANSKYFLHRDTATTFYSPFGLRFLDGNDYVDTIPNACEAVFQYYLTITDPITGGVSRSNIDTTMYEDFFPPEPQVLDYVSIDIFSGRVFAVWSEMPSSDIDSLLFNKYEGINSGAPSFSPLEQVLWTAPTQNSPNPTYKAALLPEALINIDDTTVTVAAQSIDKCGKRGDIENFHTTIDVDVVWNQCDSVMEVSWNPYSDFNFGSDTSVEYRVYIIDSVDVAGRQLFGESLDTISDTTYNYKVIESNRVYQFWIQAVSIRDDNSLMVSQSNLDSDSAFYEDEPLYGYLQYATVLDDNTVEIQMFKDTVIPVGGYTIYKGLEKDFLDPIGRVEGDEIFKDTSFQYNDLNVDVNSVSYYYQIVTENQCGGSVDTSNFGRTIHLTVEPNKEAMTNTLRWNEYQEWDSTVAYYNVYRGANGNPATELRQIVPPTENGGDNIFVDEVYDDVFAKGDFCYRVEAVQGQVNASATNGEPNKLEPAISRSNMVCVIQKPLFYVPNAFAPDGVNKVFAPKGQFFDFSLYEMKIYNRWGELVFETRDVNEGWDGTVNGNIATIGSYVYMIRFKDAEGEEHRRKGTVTIIK